MKRKRPNWHPADILAAVSKAGSNLANIGRNADLSERTPSKALYEPCYSGEQAIAAFLRQPAEVIWPDRYDEDGIPLHPRVRKKILNDDMSTISSQKSIPA